MKMHRVRFVGDGPPGEEPRPYLLKLDTIKGGSVCIDGQRILRDLLQVPDISALLHGSNAMLSLLLGCGKLLQSLLEITP